MTTPAHLNAAPKQRWWRNYCRQCGVRIRWREKAFFGNSYMPVVCEECASAPYGGVMQARAALLQAAAREVKEHGWPVLALRTEHAVLRGRRRLADSNRWSRPERDVHVNTAVRP